MAHLIACRTGVYSGCDNPYEMLAKAGVAGAEVAPPGDGDYQAMKKMADEAGVRITSLSTGIALADEENLTNFDKVIEGAGSIGTGIIFVSVKGSDEVERSALFDRWRKTADKAGEHNVTLAVETHEPFGHNAAVAVETMKDLNHPNVGMNFDTANIYYYNHDVNGVEELKNELDYVVSLHLKDTPGGYHDHNFPVLGEGIVDFPATFKILDEKGFTGPCTLELEGPLTSGKPLEERHAAVVACMDYLKSIGAC